MRIGPLRAPQTPRSRATPTLGSGLTGGAGRRSTDREALVDSRHLPGGWHFAGQIAVGGIVYAARPLDLLPAAHHALRRTSSAASLQNSAGPTSGDPALKLPFQATLGFLTAIRYDTLRPRMSPLSIHEDNFVIPIHLLAFCSHMNSMFKGP
jgi:hypothetical protein